MKGGITGLGAAALSTGLVVVGAGGFKKYKDIPESTQTNIIKALNAIVTMLSTSSSGPNTDESIAKIGCLITGVKHSLVETAQAPALRKSYSVLRRHFTKVGEDHVHILYPRLRGLNIGNMALERQVIAMRTEFRKHLEPTSPLVGKLIAKGYLRHGTTNVPARLGYGVGQTEREILHPKKAEKYKDYGRTLARENKVSAEVKALTAEERAVAEAVGSVPGLSSSLEADANLAAKEEAEHEDRVARGGFANLS